MGGLEEVSGCVEHVSGMFTGGGIKICFSFSFANNCFWGGSECGESLTLWGIWNGKFPMNDQMGYEILGILMAEPLNL